MSWDIIIFSTKQKVKAVEEIDEDLFIPIDFDKILHTHFTNIIIDDEHRCIKGEKYSIEYFADEELEGTLLFHLYGQEALFELITISKKHNWQIFDTGSGEMIDLEQPEKNGFAEYEKYRQQVLNQI